VNSLFVQIKQNIADITVSNGKRVLVHYTLTDADIDLILQQHSPASASIILDADWGECEFVPADQLSFLDRYLVKKRLKQRHDDLGKFATRPKLICEPKKVTDEPYDEPVVESDNEPNGQPKNEELSDKVDDKKIPPSAKKLANNSVQKKICVTTYDISNMSQQIMRQLLQNRVPLNKVDIRQRVILRNANIPTRFGCLVYRSDNREDTSAHTRTLEPNKVTIVVSMGNELILTRNVAQFCAEEITQTFQYIERTIHVTEDEITILLEDGIDEPMFPIKLQKNLQRFHCKYAGARYLPHKKTRFLHCAYLAPLYAGGTAAALGVLLLLGSLGNWRAIHLEKEYQKMFTTPLMSEAELSSLELKSNSQKKLTMLKKYKDTLHWGEQNFLPALAVATGTIHRGRFLQGLNCNVKRDTLSIKIEWSPSELYKESGESAPNILKKHENEILSATKGAMITKFGKPLTINAKVKDKNICLHIILNETIKTQAFQYYEFECR
jgi:hypothetical protein